MSDIASLLRRCASDVVQFKPSTLADFFGISAKHFHQASETDPIIFIQADRLDEIAFALRGTIFWPDTKQVFRGYPRSLPTSDYTGNRLALVSDLQFARAAFGGAECIAEPKLYGATIRVYIHAGDLYCATNVAHDGGNPLVGAGIDNSRSLGIDYGSQAARILLTRYGNVERLAKLGYVAVFVLQLPEFAPNATIDHADMILVDAVDPDHVFVNRLEKERIGEDYGLKVIDLAARITTTSTEPLAFLRRCRALEHQAQATPVNGAGGLIVKGRIDENADQIMCTVEPSAERDRAREITASDIAAVTDEIVSQFGDNVWEDAQFSEGLMLEYLGSQHRSVRWRVYDYLESWRAARKLIGQPKVTG